MVTPDIILSVTEIVDFVKKQNYKKYNKIFVTRFEETGVPDPWTWDCFTNEECSLLKSSIFYYFDYTSWPTYFIWSTIESTDQDPTGSENPTKHFITLNNKQHYHRCYVIDRLNQKKLLDDNLYSWNYDHIKHEGYNWLTKVEESTIQDSYNPDALSTQYVVPVSVFEDTAFSVVLESQCNNSVCFFTEKTFIPIYHQRPLIVLGNLNHWKNLNNLGFKNYPFINYDFDSEQDIKTRMDMFIEEVDRIVKKYTPNQICDMSKDICTFNYDRMLEIYRHKIAMPQWLINSDFDARIK